jgi:hypothetical protein
MDTISPEWGWRDNLPHRLSPPPIKQIKNREILKMIVDQGLVFVLFEVTILIILWVYPKKSVINLDNILIRGVLAMWASFGMAYVIPDFAKLLISQSIVMAVAMILTYGYLNLKEKIDEILWSCQIVPKPKNK